MKIFVLVIKMIWAFVNFVLIGELTLIGYVWYFSETKTEIARMIIIIMASCNTYCLTGMFMDLETKFYKRYKKQKEEKNEEAR